MAQQTTNLQGGGDSPEDVTRELRDAFESKSTVLDKVENVLRLLPKYFDPTFPREDMDKKFKPLTFWAVRNGLLHVLKELVEKYHCELCYVDHRTGQDLLYTACAKGFKEIVQYLAEQHHFDPNKPSKDKITPLFAACLKGKLDMVKLLIEKLHCNQTAQDPEGNSLVHAACRNGHLELAQYLVEQHKQNPESSNHKQETPLHLAAANGYLNVVEYLVHKLGCKLSVFDSSGLSPLHNACRNGRDKVVGCLVEKLEGDETSPYDNTGANPLHLACRSGRSEVVRVLLASGKVDPNAPTLLDQAPIEIAHDDETIKELIKWGAKPVGKTRDILLHYRDREPLKSLVYIYVIGYELSGKTTLVESLQKPISTTQKFLQLTGISSSKVKDVEERTAGIVPIEYNSLDFGKVLLFDFAGQHQFHASHEALLEYSNTATAPIFLLVVNTNEDFDEVKRKVNYWVAFIMRNPVSGTTQPHVIVIASHVDELKKRVANDRDVLVALEKHARRKLEKAKLPCKGFFSLDCRYPLKQETLRQCLKTSCQVLRTPDDELDVCCHVLRVFLLDKFRDSLCCKIKDVISKAKVSEYPLPIQADRLCELAEGMTTRTKTLFLRNHHQIEESWIVLDIDTLLQKVNGSIFAPESFGNKLSTSLQGVLRKSQLREYFPNLDPDMLVAFLRRLDFCQLVDDQEILKNIGDDDDDDEEEDSIAKDGTGNTMSSDSANKHNTPSPLKNGWLEKLYAVDKRPDATPQRSPPSPSPQVSESPAEPPHPFEESNAWVCKNPDPSPSESPTGSTEGKYLSNGTPPSLKRFPSVPTDREIRNSITPTRSFLPRNMLTRRSHSPASISSEIERPSPTPSQEYIGLRHGSADSLLFFPALITSDKPDTKLWKVDKSFKFHIGWCLECANYEHTFGQRFLTTLHLRLESRFAVRTSQGSQSECTIWKNGIHWLDMDGIEIIVEMVEDGKAVLLLMRMKEGLDTLMKGLRLRSKVIRKILDTKEQYCSKVATVEYLIDQSHLSPDHEYPVIPKGQLRNLKRYNIEIIAKAFLKPSPFVIERGKTELVSVENVVLFDPYMRLGSDIMTKIYAEDKQDQDMEDELLLEMGDKYHSDEHHSDNAEHLKKILLKPRNMSVAGTNPNQCVDVLMRYKQTGNPLAELRAELDEYSLFAGRNILKMRGTFPAS